MAWVEHKLSHFSKLTPSHLDLVPTLKFSVLTDLTIGCIYIQLSSSEMLETAGVDKTKINFLKTA